MPWGLESCRMRCRWGKINWSIATHNERRRKSIQRMNHPPPPPPTILFSRTSGTGLRTVMCCVRLYEVLWGRNGKCLCRIRFFTVPDKTCILQGKNNNTFLAKEGGEKVECSVMVIGSINALKSIPLSISTIITGPVRHSVSPGFIFYRSHCQDHFTCPLSECPIKIFNSLLLQLALLQFPFLSLPFRFVLQKLFEHELIRGCCPSAVADPFRQRQCTRRLTRELLNFACKC